MVSDTREQSQDFCRILVLTEEGKSMATGTTNLQNGSQLEKPASVDSLVISHNPKKVDHLEISDPFPSCIVTVDIEQGGTDVTKISQDTCGGSIKADISLTKPLWRQNSLHAGGESIKPLINHILMLLKFVAKEKQGVERTHDGANNRWRKYKRPNLFDSRRIVILFSIMSSMGTLVLIYLTLRVRQASDGYIHG